MCSFAKLLDSMKHLLRKVWLGLVGLDHDSLDGDDALLRDDPIRHVSIFVIGVCRSEERLRGLETRRRPLDLDAVRILL